MATGPRRGRLRRDHPCSVAFVDETGAIARDRFFGVGLLKLSDPARVLRSVQKFRDQKHWYKEIKFGESTAGTLDLYKELVDICLTPGNGAEFFCFMADRATADPVERFGSTWAAYGKLAEQLVLASLHEDELVTVLADNYSTPDHVFFEAELRSTVNRRLKRLAVTACCRLDSKSSDGLQLADLLTSAVAFEFRVAGGLASPHGHKARLSQHVRAGLGAESCLLGWRNAEHSVAVYEHGAWAPAPGA